ncbi:MAG: RNA methyltransferase [Anaerolineales bacterium]|nr:RNA methyltransferase [Anaerolineales bacterium]
MFHQDNYTRTPESKGHLPLSTPPPILFPPPNETPNFGLGFRIKFQHGIALQHLKPFVKNIRSLRQKKKPGFKPAPSSFEGIHYVGEAVDAGWEVESVVYAPETLNSAYANDLLSRLAGFNLRVQPVTAAVMESLADKENPQGILAVVKNKSRSFDDARSAKKLAALVSPQDPGNLGTILRAVDAVGADALFLLDGGVELYHPTVVRASMGALFWKPVIQTAFDDFTAWARGRGVQLIGSSSNAGADYRTLAPHEPWALILGNEQKGLSPGQISACDVTVSCPCAGAPARLISRWRRESCCINMQNEGVDDPGSGP